MKKKNRKRLCGFLFCGAIICMFYLLLTLYIKFFGVNMSVLMTDRMVQISAQKPMPVQPQD